ncbi:MAG: T9SS type A sorting domain-containing protein [Sphingobacteriaceae bacterium]
MLLFVFFGLLKAQTFQNLVPNGSFETYTNCPTNAGQIFYASPWTGPNCNSSDYFNACSSSLNVPHYAGIAASYPYFLNAKQGQAYAGIALYQQSEYREYIQVNLSNTLLNGFCYYIEFYAANIQFNKYCSNNLALSFSSTQQSVSSSSSCTLMNLLPSITQYGNPIIKDTVKWTKISGIYKSNGIESYLAIGNFLPDSQLDTLNLYPPGSTPYYTIPNAYVFIDAVSVFSINPSGNLPWQYRDTTIVQGDSVYIGNTMGGNFNPQWFTIGGSYIAANAGIYVKPATTSSYVVNYTVCGTPRSDTLEVKVVTDIKVKENELNKPDFKLFPNPATDLIEIEMDKQYFLKPMELHIKDVLGRTVITVSLTSHKQIVHLHEFNNGVYLLTLTNANGATTTKKIIVQK